MRCWLCWYAAQQPHTKASHRQVTVAYASALPCMATTLLVYKQARTSLHVCPQPCTCMQSSAYKHCYLQGTPHLAFMALYVAVSTIRALQIVLPHAMQAASFTYLALQGCVGYSCDAQGHGFHVWISPWLPALLSCSSQCLPARWPSAAVSSSSRSGQMALSGGFSITSCQ